MPTLGDTHRTPRTVCPYCDNVFDAATGVDAKRSPRPGDISLCIDCASPLQFDANLQLAKITDAELRAGLTADQYASFQHFRRTLLMMDRRRA
jgi:hypothetical protein